MSKKSTNYTFEDRKKIEYQLKNYPTLSLSEIARRIGKSKNGVIVEVRTKGGRQNYTAIEAQKIHDQAILDGREKLRIRNQGIDPNRPIRDQIDALKMHIEIIYEELQQIKGMLNDSTNNKL